MGENAEKEHVFMSIILHDFYSSCTVSLFYSTNIYYTLTEFCSVIFWGYPEICIVFNSLAPAEKNEAGTFVV